MSRFIPDLRGEPRAAKLLRSLSLEIEQAAAVACGDPVPKCARKQWTWVLDNLDTLGPSELFSQTDGQLQFLDGRTRAVCLLALGRAVPSIEYSEEEVREWQLQRKSS